MQKVELTMGKMTRFGHTLYDFWYRNEDKIAGTFKCLVSFPFA